MPNGEKIARSRLYSSPAALQISWSGHPPRPNDDCLAGAFSLIQVLCGPNRSDGLLSFLQNSKGVPKVKMPTFALLLLAVLTGGLFAWSPAFADRVVPSDRVTSSLNVRAHESADSPIVGKMTRAESAELLAGFPYWFQVKLSDGTVGFVSKAWATRIPEMPGQNELLRIGSWNLKKLGHGGQKDIATMARVIDSTFDVAALLEVMQKGGGHPGYDELLSALGPGWKGVVTETPRPNSGSGNAEFYAFVYRPAKAHLCPGWGMPEYAPDNDGSGNESTPDLFSREPVFECFEAGQGNTVGMDFLLAAYHARWEGGNKTAIKGEVGHLGEVFQAMSSARPGEKDLFIAGDFNLGDADIQEALGTDPGTSGSGSTLNSHGELTGNVYDHILVWDRSASKEMIGGPEIINAIHEASSGQAFYTQVSDHLPVVTHFSVMGPDDD